MRSPEPAGAVGQERQASVPQQREAPVRRSGAAGRDVGLDLVRVVGVLAVVVGHVYRDPLSLHLTYTWHVPLFFVLSGYLWTPGRPLREEVRRRARTLLVPYASWLVAVLAWLVLWTRGTGVLSRTRDVLLGGSYAPKPHSAFWFVTALFVAVVVLRALERVPAWLRLGVVLGGWAAAEVAGEQLARVPLAAGSALGALVLVAAGQGLRRLRPRLPAVPVAVGLLLGSALLVGSGLSEPQELKFGDLGTPVLSVVVSVAVSAALVLLGEQVGPHLPAAARRAVAVLAPALLAVVLSHGVFLRVWVKGDALRGEVWGGRPLVLAVTLVVPTVAAVLLSRSQLAPWATGQRRQVA